MAVLEVRFRYFADPSDYDTNDAAEMAKIDLESIQNGDTDISDLFSEDALDTVTIVSVSE